ncbi:MAG: protein arginine kinase [Limnochordaceae bacterium]|nr:protein arginine kinase [Limnochordaceae bacterium]
MIRRHVRGWMVGQGPDSDVVLGTRVRLARNLKDIPFPGVATQEQLHEVVKRVRPAIESLDARWGGPLKFTRMGDVPDLTRQLLVERHLISPAHTQQVREKAFAVRDDEAASIMVNEEDHLRIQALFAGFQLEEALNLADRVDDGLSERLEYAFSERVGYLTAWPTNVGTGLRASVMLHLPALAMAGQLQHVLSAVARFGVAVRGLYGEGTESVGNIFQISNQVSLGRSEDEILKHLANLAHEVVGHERTARQRLMSDRRALEDRIWRSYGVLRYSRAISSQEAMQRLSDVRLGIDLGIIEGLDQRILTELLVVIRPAHLQSFMGRELTPAERDVHRAALIRERIRLPNERLAQGP